MISNALKFFQSGISGAGPGMFFGVDAPDGDRGDWVAAPVGSLYYRKCGEGGIWYEKKTATGVDADWRPCGGAIVQTVALADFTDGGAAVGTLVLDYGIPVGATVVRTYLLALTGFTGDTSCTLIVGDGTDTDRYNTGTPSIFTTAAGETDLGAISGVAYHSAAKSITLTATSGSDWGAVTAGAATVVVVLG